MCLPSSDKTDRSQELTNYGRLSSSADKLSDAGGGDTGTASKYFSDLVSGNPTALASAAEPETAAITGEEQQNKNVLANSGNRSGGTNAQTQSLTQTGEGQIGDAVAKARSAAAPALASIGTGETGAGLTADSTIGTEATDNRKQSYAENQDAQNQWGGLAAEFLLGS